MYSPTKAMMDNSGQAQSPANSQTDNIVAHYQGYQTA